MSRYSSEIFQVSFIPAILIIGWTWLLHFPWNWVLYSVIAIQLIFACIVFSLETDASTVSGAPGWMACFSFFAQFAFVAVLTLIRIIVWVFQLFF